MPPRKPDPKPEPKPRDVWRANVHGDHRCVVIGYDATTKKYKVVYGQTVHGSGDCVCVRGGTTDGHAIEGTTDTHFREENDEEIPRSAFRRFIGKCPAGLYGKIEKMLEAKDLRAAATASSTQAQVVQQAVQTPHTKAAAPKPPKRK